VANDAKFHAIVEEVLEAIGRDAAAHDILKQAIRQLRGAPEQ
jgi:hypothetical protein